MPQSEDDGRAADARAADARADAAGAPADAADARADGVLAAHAPDVAASDARLTSSAFGR